MSQLHTTPFDKDVITKNFMDPEFDTEKVTSKLEAEQKEVEQWITQRLIRVKIEVSLILTMKKDKERTRERENEKIFDFI